MKNKYHWIIKYKLYHLPFWFVYHFSWWTLRLGNPADVFYSLFYLPSAVKFFFYFIFQAIGVYFNLYFLIPRFLEKGRYVPYIGLVLLTIIVTAACIVTGYYVGASFSDRPFQELYGVDPKRYFYLYESGALSSTAASMTLAMSIKLTKKWIQTRRREQELEKEKLETELKFLRAQFNPHFLFNTINSIFVLIHKNPDMASEALAKFSDLLRYQLYECNEHEIPLSKELIYLEGFIELERLRQDSQHLSLDVNIAVIHNPDLVIAPFILIPFIENAFKHVSKNKNRSNWIKLNFHMERNQLVFKIANSITSFSSLSNDFIQYHGLGLKNVKRRLELIYPNLHTLSIHKDEDHFEVMLKITLAEHVINEALVGKQNQLQKNDR
ncbi:MAG: histidine kinase [Saprospiraceae bacterium]